MMKKIMRYVLCVAITSSSVLADQDYDICKSLKGDLVWNGALNQWQCENLSDADKDTYAKYIIGKDTSEGNTTATYAQPHNNETTDSISLKKALGYAVMPVYVAGAIVYYTVLTVVVAPVWLVQKTFGGK